MDKLNPDSSTVAGLGGHSARRSHGTKTVIQCTSEANDKEDKIARAHILGFSDVSATIFDDAIAKERTPLSTVQEDLKQIGRILEQLLSAAQRIEDALSSRRSDVSSDRLPREDGVAIQEIDVLVSD